MSTGHHDEDPGSPKRRRAEVTRSNALRHGVLSRYTVLPWEDADEIARWSRPRDNQRESPYCLT